MIFLISFHSRRKSVIPWRVGLMFVSPYGTKNFVSAEESIAHGYVIPTTDRLLIVLVHPLDLSDPTVSQSAYVYRWLLMSVKSTFGVNSPTIPVRVKTCCNAFWCLSDSVSTDDSHRKIPTAPQFKLPEINTFVYSCAESPAAVWPQRTSK